MTQAQAIAQKSQGDLVYENPLKHQNDITGFRLEGQALIDFDQGRLRMKNALSSELGQASNFVFWAPVSLPSSIEIQFNFWPEQEPGLAILFFAARGLMAGKPSVSIFDGGLKPRSGIYEQYTQSDISALQIAYFRRRWPEERAFHVSNLRRAPGFELLATGPDPIPDVEDVRGPYRMRIRKTRQSVTFFINDLMVLDWKHRIGPMPQSGHFGFRQMAPLIASYSDLKVYAL